MASTSVHGHMLRGSIWAISLRWGIRATGLVSTVILARLLTPADFGVVAMAMLVVGALEVLTETGQRLAIIRHPNPTPDHYNTAWTISVLIGLGASLLCLAVAPLTESYFHEPRAVLVIQSLAIRPLIGGLENIGVVAFRRELAFARDFRFAIYQKLIGFVITVTAAFLLRNYWALVIGVLAGRTLSVLLSYAMHPFRPRFGVKHARELWSFSIWALIKHIGNYFGAKIDEFAVGGAVGAVSMGQYNVAADVATAPTQELTGPIAAALFPVMSTVQHDAEKARELFLRTLYWLGLVSASTGVGVSLIADEVVPLILGPQWGSAAPVMIWLALSASVMGVTGCTYVAFEVAGQPRISARMQWIRLVALAAVLVPVARIGTLEQVAAARFAVGLVMAPMLFVAVRQVLPVTLSQIGAVLSRPFFAAALMAASVIAMDRLTGLREASRLLCELVLGASVFLGTCYGLWRLAGSPEGPEAAADAWLRSRVDALRQRSEDEQMDSDVPPIIRQSGALNICLYAPIASSREYRPVRRSLFRTWRNRVKRSCFEMIWRFVGLYGFDVRDWSDHIYTNRGDIAIRKSIEELLKARFGANAVFHELTWGELTPARIDDINSSCDLFVICGGGYIFLNEDGSPKNRRLIEDAALIPLIRCRKIAFGIGANSLIEGQSPEPSSDIPEVTRDALARLMGSLDLVGVRGTPSQELISATSGRPVHLIGDPALHLVPAPLSATSPAHGRSGRLKIGVNFALHGQISSKIFAQCFDHIRCMLTKISKEHDADFYYFVHCDMEKIGIKLMSVGGVRFQIVDLPPEEMLTVYGQMDVVICQMLHSAILATNAGVPSMNIAYDIKNGTFYNLMGMAEYCLDYRTANAETMSATCERLLSERLELRTRIADRNAELAHETQRFLDRVEAMMDVAAADKPARASAGAA